jgi:hypothetical protein
VIAALSLVLAACASEDPEANVETTTNEKVATTTTEVLASTTTTAGATTTTEAAPTTEQFPFLVPVTITLPSDWTGSLEAGSQVLLFEAPNGYGAFVIESPELTVDGWMERIMGQPNLDASEPEATEVGGAPGFSFDARVGNATEGLVCGDAGFCVSIAEIPEHEYGWVVLKGYPNRIRIVDVNGTAVLVTAEATEAAFESFVAQFEEVLATVEWAGG